MIPSKLNTIERRAFAGCKHLKKIEFLEGRETFGEDVGVWNRLFRDCKVEEVALPSTLKEMSPEIF